METKALDFAFEGMSVRVKVGADGEPWFVAADVCAVLEIGNPSQAVSRLDDDERTLISNEGGSPTNAVSEAGLYSLVLSSRKPEAKAFKRWVTHEVLPQIRKTGAYAAPQSFEAMTLAVVTGLQSRLAEATKRLAIAEPKAAALDVFTDNGEPIGITKAAKGLGVQPKWLFERLERDGWIYRLGGAWAPKQSVITAGLMAFPWVPKDAPQFQQAMMTHKGIVRIAREMTEEKQMALTVFGREP